MPTVNERILEGQIKHSIFLERYKSGVLQKIVGQLNASEADLTATIAKRLALIEDRGFDLGPATTKRLKALLDEIKEKRSETYAALETALSDEMNEFSRYEADFQVKLADTAGVTHTLTLPGNSQLKAIVTSQPFQGRLLKEWVKDMAGSDVSRIQDAIRLGMTQNETLDQIVRRVRGTKAKRYEDGVLQISRRNAESVVRTAVAHVQARAKMEVYEANADIIHKVQYIATLDSRTTSYCIQHDHKLYEIGKQPVIPAHWGCRSTYAAYFEGVEGGSRASQFGPVPENTDYDTFLRKQSKDFQEDVLGVERARLYRSGTTTIGKFIDKTGKFYTLKQLKQRET